MFFLMSANILLKGYICSCYQAITYTSLIKCFLPEVDADVSILFMCEKSQKLNAGKMIAS